MTNSDMIYCSNLDCPYRNDCWQSAELRKGKIGLLSFANLGARCPKYVRHVADRNEKEKARVMKQCR